MAVSGIACPFCDSTKAELVSLFGSQLLLSQYRCTGCRSYFEGVRDDRRDGVPGATATGGTDDGR